jgi:hypothetical protein
MNPVRIACVGALALVAAASLARAQAQDANHWTWHGAIAPGKTLEIRGVNGTIRAEPGTGSEVEVTADKHGRDDDPSTVRIEAVPHEGGVTICAVYPGRDNECRPGGGHMSVRDNDVEVRFVARVPAGVAFVGNNVNGGVEAAGLAAPVQLYTVNGGVTLETSSGEASAETVNGGIRATVHGAGQGRLSFTTVNGSVDLSLAAGLSADLSAETVNGSIESDFPITLSGRINPRHLEGRIGQGGRVLRLRTVNGGIRVHSLP